MTLQEKQLTDQIELESTLMIQRQKLGRIEGFNGYFSFLKTEHPCKVLFEGEFYNSVAHAYEAAKTTDEVERRRIRKAPTYKEMMHVAKLVK